MQTLIKIFFIFLFYWIGEFLSYLMGGFVPGSVLGMLLLFLALQLSSSRCIRSTLLLVL